MIIAIDFDGTCVTHEFPKIGKDIGAVPVLKRLVEAGHQLVLFTMRSDKHDNTGTSIEVPEVHNGNFLTNAVNWFKENDIPLYGININPQQTEWTTSPKAYAQLYIDDAALGAPLTRNKDLAERPFIDWASVEAICEMDGILPITNEFIGAIREDMKENEQLSTYDQFLKFKFNRTL